MNKPTEEQEEIVDYLKNNDGLVAVKAFAGCGKTSTLQLIVAELKPKKGFYTAFNSSIVKEAKEKFPSSINCQTQHAFALRYVKPKKPIQDFSYHDIKEKISYGDKRLIIDAVDAFYRSASTDMYEYLDSALEEDKLVNIAIKYIDKMVDGKMSPSFNYLLKHLHLLLVEKQVEINYDIVLYDEVQDAVGVMLEIIKLINAPKKVLVGDSYQNIYAYMKTINAFKVLDMPTLKLTRSFRCSPEIAARIEKFGKIHLESDFHYTGTVTEPDDTIAYISRTNAGIITRMNKMHLEGKSYTLTRKVDDIFAMPMALVTAASGKEVYNYKYKYLEKEYKNYTLSNSKSFFNYLSAHVDDQEMKNAIKMLMQFREKGVNLFDVRKEAKLVKPNPNIYLVTAHSFKGRECSTVYIEDNMNHMMSEIVDKGGPEDDDDLQNINLAYVAATRARNTLLNCKYL